MPLPRNHFWIRDEDDKTELIELKCIDGRIPKRDDELHFEDKYNILWLGGWAQSHDKFDKSKKWVFLHREIVDFHFHPGHQGFSGIAGSSVSTSGFLILRLRLLLRLRLHKRSSSC